MGKWVTSKGRHIYIPDEGEENPFVGEAGKKDDSAIRYLAKRENVAYDVAKGVYNGMSASEKKHFQNEAYLKNNANKDADEKERQIVRNKAEADKLNKVPDYVKIEQSRPKNMSKSELEKFAKSRGLRPQDHSTEELRRILDKMWLDEEMGFM